MGMDLGILKNPYVKKMEQLIRKTGFNETFIRAAVIHLKRIYEYQLSGAENYTREMICYLLLSKTFMDRIDLYPLKRFNCQVTENSEIPVPVLPCEVFEASVKLPDEFRVASFYAFLQKGDLLECRVAAILATQYNLRVIHKYNVTQMLDDLKIMVKMDRSELVILKKELLVCELIRAAVVSVKNGDEQEITVHVTVDEKRLEPRENQVKLGRISEEDLPFYVIDPPDPEKYSSYGKYLKTMPQFRNSPMINEVFEGFGTSPRVMYSLYPDYDRFKCVEEFTGEALRKKSRLSDAKHFSDSSLTAFKSNNYPAALDHVNAALELCPLEERLRIVLYKTRADIYNILDFPKYLKEAIHDLFTLHHLDPNNKDIKIDLSKTLFKVANKMYRAKAYEKAFHHAKLALEFNPSNSNASALLDYLHVQHPEVCSEELNEDFTNAALEELQKKKMKLVSELKKYKKKKLVDY